METSESKTAFKGRLLRARNRAGMSQTDLAHRIGVTPQSVQKWEAGTAEPTPRHALRLAQVLEVAPEWLIYGVDRGDPVNVTGHAPAAVVTSRRDRAVCDDLVTAAEKLASAMLEYRARKSAAEQFFFEIVVTKSAAFGWQLAPAARNALVLERAGRIVCVEVQAQCLAPPARDGGDPKLRVFCQQAPGVDWYVWPVLAGADAVRLLFVPAAMIGGRGGVVVTWASELDASTLAPLAAPEQGQPLADFLDRFDFD